MKSPYNFVVKPIGGRYNNKKNIGDKELILNTEIFNHHYINRLAEVISTPIIAPDLGIKPGDKVLVHHNVFRRWHDVKGRERNSKNFFDEDTYIIAADQIFLYKPHTNWSRFKESNWVAPKGFCFVQPVKNTDEFDQDVEKPLVGVIKYTDGSFEKEQLIGFRPGSEYEFVFEGKRLYRVYSNLITIVYGHKEEEEEYNPSWLQSS